MKLKIPPVVVVLVAAFLMYMVNYLTKEFASFSFSGQQLTSRIFFGLCMLCVISGIYAFSKMKTTVDPRRPREATSLVIIGIYRFTRNPMYLGMLLLLAGWGVKLGNPLNFSCLVLFVWYMTNFQIKPEEDALKENFGTSYLQFCEKVRRWI